MQDLQDNLHKIKPYNTASWTGIQTFIQSQEFGHESGSPHRFKETLSYPAPPSGATVHICLVGLFLMRGSFFHLFYSNTDFKMRKIVKCLFVVIKRVLTNASFKSTFCFEMTVTRVIQTDN